MFENAPATAMIPAKDPDRARQWYEAKLGIKGEVSDYGVNLKLNGVDAYIYPTQFAGTAQHTILTFTTKDLLADMAEMRKRGVTFEEYDLPDLKTENGIASWGEVKNAWCKDSEGNILGFVQGM